MKKLFVIALAASIVVPIAVSAATLKGSRYLPQAKVGLAQARAAALKAEHGTIVGVELEKERGGSGLRYSFAIKVGTVLREVGIDAASGKVLEDVIDTGND